MTYSNPPNVGDLEFWFEKDLGEQSYKIRVLITALKNIKEPHAPFSRDPLTFARNTIERQIAIATDAIDKVENFKSWRTEESK